jgi:hypothetical protein
MEQLQEQQEVRAQKMAEVTKEKRREEQQEKRISRVHDLSCVDCLLYT